MRIIAGIHRGRPLLSPPDYSIRPTGERTREAVFNLLMHGPFDPSPVIDQIVLDLCCGSGALGLEALSRGAAQAIFVDSKKPSIELAEQNAAKLQETPRCKFIQCDVLRLPKAHAPVGLVLIDAPYRSGLLQPTYGVLQFQGWLKPGTVIAGEQGIKEVLPELEGAQLHTERHYGRSKIGIWVVS
jgi:16S rRNA (guanine966-N2)-methyltransferase